MKRRKSWDVWKFNYYFLIDRKNFSLWKNFEFYSPLAVFTAFLTFLPNTTRFFFARQTIRLARDYTESFELCYYRLYHGDVSGKLGKSMLETFCRQASLVVSAFRSWHFLQLVEWLEIFSETSFCERFQNFFQFSEEQFLVCQNNYVCLMFQDGERGLTQSTLH